MEARTLPDLVFENARHFGKPDCLKAKKGGAYVDISCSELAQRVEALAAKLLDLKVQKGDRIGLLSENRPEWAYADLAILTTGAITVPIYPTLPPGQIQYLIEDSGMEILFLSTPAQLEKILALRGQVPFLKLVLVGDPPGGSLPEGVMALATAFQEGQKLMSADPEMVRKRLADVQPDDIATIVYTSGTTGEPKGVMLSHANIISNVRAIDTHFSFLPTDIAISFLPLSHIFERMAGYYTMLYFGCTIAYAENVESLGANMAEVRPTAFVSVPRVYEKFHQRIMDNYAAEHGIKKKIMGWALRVAAEYTHAEIDGSGASAILRLKHGIADRLVYSKVRARMGGRLRLLISGGAALPRQLAYFFHGFGLTIFEGYGLTETSPVIACNHDGQVKFGTVGKPIPGTEVKIAEDGEVVVRGPGIMKGYYKKPEETAEVLSPDGWFCTGDIGELDADGYLRITDRKKDIIVTSGGKNIAPQYVENMLKTSQYVSQIVVLGDRRKFVSALIVPNMENVWKLAAGRQIPESEVLTHPVVLEEIQRDLEEHSKNLATFERVKKFALLAKEFTIDSGEMTPSLKIRRNIVESRYRDLIDSLYS